MATPKILLIYTGGTIGMVADPATGALKPLDFRQLEREIPALRQLGVEIEYCEELTPIDSSDVTPEKWAELARVIGRNYDCFDGFVVLHGTDTMAWTASAVSFMLENLTKPVIFTGSQIPIGVMRTDGRENLVTAVEIAAARVPANTMHVSTQTGAGGGRKEQRNFQPSAGRGFGLTTSAGSRALSTLDFQRSTSAVPEVAIYFQSKLFRANRTTKWSAEQLDAFTSENYPPLAEVGVTINYHRENIFSPAVGADGFAGVECTDGVKCVEKLRIHTEMCTDVALVRLFPGMEPRVLEAVLEIEGLRGVMLQTYGAGNTPTAPWFLDAVGRAVERGMVVVNVTQCIEGAVTTLYESGLRLSELGVTSGGDMTVEAAMVKLMYVLGRFPEPAEAARAMRRSLRGEMTG